MTKARDENIIATVCRGLDRQPQDIPDALKARLFEYADACEAGGVVWMKSEVLLMAVLWREFILLRAQQDHDPGYGKIEERHTPPVAVPRPIPDCPFCGAAPSALTSAAPYSVRMACPACGTSGPKEDTLNAAVEEWEVLADAVAQ